MRPISRQNSTNKRSSTPFNQFVESLEARQLLSAAPTLWADDAQGRLFTVNPGTGQVHVVGKMPAVMFDIAFDAHGNLYGVDNAPTSNLWKINPNNASASKIGSVGTFVNSLVFSTKGTLYGAGNALYAINTVNGHGTRVGNSNLNGFSSAGDLAFDSTGALYLSTTNNNLVRVNISTGAATLVGPIGFKEVYGMAFGPNGVLYGMSDATDQIFSISRTTGHGTLLSSFANKGVVGVNGSSFPTEAIPANPGVTIFASDVTGNLFTVNSASGQTHVIGHMARVMYDIAFDKSGHLYGIDSANELWNINPSTAAISFIGSLKVSDNINSLIVGPDGNLYAAGHDLYKIVLSSRLFYDQGRLGGYASAGDLAFDKNGDLVMSTTSNQLVKINPATAKTTLLGAIGFQQVLGLAEGSDGVLYGMSDTTDQIFSIDPITGKGSSPVHFSGVNGVYGAAVDPV
jgi:streptogramin lyase